jgi:hypothetical protein
MQTFLPYKDPIESAKVLDNKRLGKQRVEAIQIARSLLGITDGWKNHPAVKMWKGYEPYLIKVYLKNIMDEWEMRGFKNEKCYDHYLNLLKIVDNKRPIRPHWLSEIVCQSHRSRLIQKKPEHYANIFEGTPHDLEYVWPV